MSALTPKPRVVFFDELPWLAARRSGILPALEHFWNAWASRQSWLKLVVCGSAASWMRHHLLEATGGLHNRVTQRIRLESVYRLSDEYSLFYLKWLEPQQTRSGGWPARRDSSRWRAWSPSASRKTSILADWITR